MANPLRYVSRYLTTIIAIYRLYLSVIYILVHIGSFFNRYSIGKLVIYVQRRSKGAQNLEQSPAIQLLQEVERCVYGCVCLYRGKVGCAKSFK